MNYCSPELSQALRDAGLEVDNSEFEYYANSPHDVGVRRRLTDGSGVYAAPTFSELWAMLPQCIHFLGQNLELQMSKHLLYYVQNKGTANEHLALICVVEGGKIADAAAQLLLKLKKEGISR